MESEYIYKEFDHSDYPLFSSLYKNVFGKSISRDEFKNRFDTEARGHKFIGYLAIERETGHAAAFYGVFPLKIVVKGFVLPAAVSGDTMTGRDHRGKGLFKRLATMTYGKCKEAGMVLIYGFPNENSYHGLIHSLGWTHANDLIEWNFSFRMKISPIHKFLKYSAFCRQIFFRSLHKLLKKYIPKDINVFSNEMDPQYGKVFRDQNYVRYKRGAERIFIKIGEVIIWLRFSTFLWIGDFHHFEKINDHTISELKKIARLSGYNSIRFALNREIKLPQCMQEFKVFGSIASCVLYLDKQTAYPPFIFTPADFDTW